MSEAKSLVVWKRWWDLLHEEKTVVKSQMTTHGVRFADFHYEYAHDLSGRFLGVFREVRA